MNKKKSPQTKTTWTRVTIPFKNDQLEKMRAYAYLEGKEFKDVLAELIDSAISLKKVSVQETKLTLLKSLINGKTQEPPTEESSLINQ